METFNSPVQAHNERIPCRIITWPTEGPCHASVPTTATAAAPEANLFQNLVAPQPALQPTAPAGPVFNVATLTLEKPLAGKVTLFQLDNKADFGVKTTDLAGLLGNAVAPPVNILAEAPSPRIVE